MFIPLVFSVSFVLSESTTKIVLASLYLFLAVAMVANFQMLKLRGVWNILLGNAGAYNHLWWGNCGGHVTL